MALSDEELRSGRNLARWIVAGTVVALLVGIALYPRGASGRIPFVRQHTDVLQQSFRLARERGRRSLTAVR